MKVLKKDYVDNTCKIGQGHNCCRYLLMGTGGFECGKLSDEPVRSMAGDSALSHKELMDKRVEKKTCVASGDNCDGIKID